MNLPNTISKSTIARNPHLFGQSNQTPDASSLTMPLAQGAFVSSGRGAVPSIRKSVEERLNKTECRWLAELRRRQYGPIHIQAVILQIGHDCRYTCDFFTPLPRPRFWEVKGFRRDDAMVKLRVAARVHSWAKFVLVEWEKKAWIEMEIAP